MREAAHADRALGFYYDPLVGPDAEVWLSLDDQERIAAVLAWHAASSAPHPPTPKPTLHAALHAVVENQAAANDPPAVTATLTRLCDAGLTRHEAVHAIASVVGDALQSALDGADGGFDVEAYAQDMRALEPGDWRT